MADPPPEAIPTKEGAILFVEINIEAEAAEIEVVKNATGEGYVGKAKGHPE
jgi:hypothetical protein